MSKGSKLPPLASGSGQEASQRPARPHERGVSQARAAAPHLKGPPAAPPVYRPQPVPKVLQTKKAAAAPPPPATHARPAPAAPPAYRPQPPARVLQPKASAVRQPGACRPSSQPAAPPAHAPRANNIVQPKTALEGARAATQARHTGRAPQSPPGRVKSNGTGAPARLAPRRAPSSAAVIQRSVETAETTETPKVTLTDMMRMDELRSISRVLRGYGKTKDTRVQEFQGMRYGSQILVTGNEESDTDKVFETLQGVTGAKARTELSSMGSKALTRTGSGEDYDIQESDPRLTSETIWELAMRKGRVLEQFTSNTVGPKLAAEQLTTGGPSMVLVSGSGLHAEQRLLVVLSNRLATDDDPPDTIHVGGSKPPCTRCKPVVEAFEEGLKRFYGVKLNYVKNGTRKRCGTEVAQVTVSDLPTPNSKSPAAYVKLIEYLRTALG